MPKSNSKKPKKNAKNHFKKESIDLAKAETLESIKPRDVFGGSTGKRFEYQYEQSAKACLELLEEDEICCVFCEWHDDFVVEKSAPSSKAKVLYVFNQVKTREGAQGPWDIYNVFGINKIKITQPNKITSSFAYKLFRHFVDFGSSCDSLVFLTNAAIDKDFENFYLQVQSTETWNKLDTKRKELFELLFKNYEKVFDSLNKDQFFDMLKRFQVVAEEIPLGQSKTAFQSNLTEKIHRLSEIDLLHTEATS